MSLGSTRATTVIDAGADSALATIATGARLSEFGQSITIRRGGSSLSAQRVRIVHKGANSKRESNASEQPRAMIQVEGGTTLDIAPGDRFNDADGELYEVEFVRANRQVNIVAEAFLVQ